jgi:hypothetical protein
MGKLEQNMHVLSPSVAQNSLVLDPAGGTAGPGGRKQNRLL